MKKLLASFISFLLILTCAFAVACSNGEANSASGGQSVNSTEGGDDSAQASDSNSASTSEKADYSWSPSTVQHNGANTGSETTTVFLVGDSTVCEYSMTKEASRYYPRNGYGMWFDDFLSDKVTVQNLALSGRSSRSFLTEANYQTLCSNISAGDYLVIGFGHNDEKTGAGYYTSAMGEVIHEDSFKYHLYNYYVKVALDAGATPILCTPIIRIATNYKDSNFHVIASTTDYEFGDYPKAIRELGAEFGITVIDNTQITKDFFAAMTYDEAKQYYSTNSLDVNSIDNTHLNSYGAATVAYKFMLALQATDNSLKNYIDTAKMVEPDISVRVVSQNVTAE